MDVRTNYALLFKAMADETRLQIVEMLSCGEMCACVILDYFQITQPTLSYHMKILTDSGIVTSRKEGSWVYYHNNPDVIMKINEYWSKISRPQEDCICKTYKSTNSNC